jgi:hypothetical protein
LGDKEKQREKYADGCSTYSISAVAFRRHHASTFIIADETAVSADDEEKIH